MLVTRVRITLPNFLAANDAWENWDDEYITNVLVNSDDDEVFQQPPTVELLDTTVERQPSSITADGGFFLLYLTYVCVYHLIVHRNCQKPGTAEVRNCNTRTHRVLCAFCSSDTPVPHCAENI